MEFTKRILEVGGPILVVAVGTCLFQTLPESVLEFLTVWTLVSVPAGVVIGHCALSEDDTTVA
jgi:hypothetical protein